MAATVSLTEDQIQMHNNTLLHLMATREKLMGINPNSLPPDEQSEWTKQMNDVSRSILLTEGAILTACQ